MRTITNLTKTNLGFITAKHKEFSSNIELILLILNYLCEIMIEKINEKIRQIRELKNLSQEFIAKELGLSIRAYSKIESGETQLTINRLNEISKILGVTSQEVLGFDANVVIHNGGHQQGGKAENNVYNQTEVKFIKELYEKLLTEKDLRIAALEKQLQKC